MFQKSFVLPDWRRLNAIIILSVVFASLSAQSAWLYTTDMDMPNSLVNDVVEDSDHMIWVSTEDGLIRYDGGRFVLFKNTQGDVHSLQDNYVRTVYCDAEGDVLVGTRRGVQVYRPETGDFSELATFEDGGLTDGDITEMLQLPNGDIMAVGNSLCTIRLDEQGNPKLLRNELTDKLSNIDHLTFDTHGNLWLIRRMQELYCFDATGNLSNIEMKGADLPCNALHLGVDGQMYFGHCNGGLYRYDEASKQIVQVGDNKNCLIRDFLDLSGNRLLLGTDNEGALVYDYATDKIVPLDYSCSSLNIYNQKVHAMCLDSEDNIWMALYQKGLLFVPRHPLSFHLMGHRTLEYNCIGDKCVTSICQGQDGLMWVATDNGGLYGVTVNGEQKVYYPTVPSDSLSAPSSLMKVYEDSKGRLWFGSYNQGFGVVDRKKGTFVRKSVVNVRKSMVDIYDFLEDNNNQLWAASMGSGVFIFDEGRQALVPALHFDSCRWNNDFKYDPVKNRIWVGSYNGLTEIDANNPEGNHKQYLTSDIIFSIALLNADSLCLCSDHGLIIFDTNTGTYERVGAKDGLPDGNFYAIETDNEGNAWVTGNNGMSRYNVNTRQITNFVAIDGLQGNEFYKNSSIKDSQGRLWFGGTNGITWFNPKEIEVEEIHCSASIVNMMASGKPSLGRIDFDNSENAITFAMGVYPRVYTRRTYYIYSLDNDAWAMLPPQTNTVSYSHMRSGNHVFRFKAVVNGVESKVEEYRFHIGYPWFLQWWALMLWGIAIIFVIANAYMQFRHRREVKKRLALHEQNQAISDAKLQFFTNIAHEIRTPMTLIVGPLGKLMKYDSDMQHQHSYKLIMRNANRILLLMNQLLDVRKAEKKQMHLLCRQVKIGPYTAQLCQSFEDVADLRKVQLKVDDHTAAGTKVWVDIEHYDKILSNLLSNALKFTPEGGYVAVELTTKPASDTYPEGAFVLSVTDNGRGVSEADKPYLFDRFYQVQASGVASLGTGIGLYLTRFLAQLHHGDIIVCDNPEGKGARFEVSLPLGRSHLTTVEMTTEEVEQESVDTFTSVTQIATATLYSAPENGNTEVASTRTELLIAEDDLEICSYLQSELSPIYHVTICHNGVEALAAMQKHCPDIVVTDVMMPEMDGLTLCQKVRQNILLNHVPIVMLTAKAREEEQIEGIEVGADAYLTKPYSIEVLKSTIHNLVISRERLRNAYNGNQVAGDQVATPDRKSPDERLLERVLKVIEANLSNPDLTIEMVAKAAGLSRVHLFRKLKELTNQAPTAYIRNVRLQKAADIMRQKRGSIAEIAKSVGFENPGSFTTCFHNMYGVSPSEFMNEHHKEISQEKE